jgi:predicted PurR-regulated permease PerM
LLQSLSPLTSAISRANLFLLRQNGGPILMSEEPQVQKIETARPVVPRHHWSLTLLGIALILAFVYYGELVLAVLCISILLAFVLAPIAEGLERLRLRRGIASLTAVLLLVGAVYGVIYVSYNQAQIFADNLPKYSQKIRSMLKPFRAQAEMFQRTTEVVQEPEPPGAKSIVTVRPATNWTDLLTHGFGSISEGLLAASFIPFLVYFMLTWQHHARSATVMLFPLRHRNTAFITLGLIAKMLRSFIVGNMLMGLFISGVSVAVFGFLHVPFFYFIGFLSGFLSLVPYLGVVLAMGPPVLVGLGQMDREDLAIVIFTVMGLHLFALNVLYPKFLGSRLKLNPLAVTIALLFWGFTWGAVGLVLAVPMTAAMKIIFDHVEPLKPYAAWLGE